MCKGSKLKLGIVFGGRSGEHDVSLVSAASIMKALDKEKYEIIPIGISKININQSSITQKSL